MVSFATALLEGAVRVEGVEGRRWPDAELDLAEGLAFVPVLVDPEADAVARLRPDVLVDGRMLKRAPGTSVAQAPLVIGLGPGFAAGVDAHAVVETQRGPSLGRVLWSGPAEADTGVPSPVLGVTEARELRAPASGTFRAVKAIGDLVQAGDVLGRVGEAPVQAEAAGIVRGLVADGVAVAAGIKLGDIDPRGAAVDPAAVSDKARAVAAGVLEAILVGASRL
jgi:xanthine dehydrogenase accessory factor